ncbi:MAG: zf-HC2 domain-containing protein [Armatimonadota bacterium]
MPACDVYRLQSLVDGELSDLESAEFMAHVQSCAACSRLLASLRLVAEPLRNVSDSAPEGLQERLVAAVAGMQPLPALSCDEALELVSARLDGELSHAQCQHLVAHLDGCAACEAAAAQTEMTGAVLRAIAPEAPPAGLLERIQAAAELAAPPARRPVPWRRWVPSFAGVAAAAALVVALLANSPQPPTLSPMVAQTPAIERAAKPAVSESPVRVVPSNAVAALSPPAPSAAPLTRIASTNHVAKSKLSAPGPSPTQRVASASVSPAERGSITPPSALPMPPSPAVAPETEVRQPMNVAVAPTRVVQPETAHDVRVAAIPHADTPPAPAARTPETPRPVRVATMDGPKATPTAVQPRKPAEKRQRTWVSRADNDEREVYKSEDASTRLADARDRLDRDIRHIVDSEVKGFVIH